MARRAAKIDANQPEIVSALRSIPGVTVAVDHHDILVGYRGKTYWFEIKESEASAKLNTETAKKQREHSRTWAGHYAIVWSLDMILVEMGITGRE